MIMMIMIIMIIMIIIVFTEGQHFPSCHVLCCCLHYFAICCNILPYVSHVAYIFPCDNCLEGIAALLRQPRLSRPRLEAGESETGRWLLAEEHVVRDVVRRAVRDGKICTCICVYVYIYIYKCIYIHIDIER